MDFLGLAPLLILALAAVIFLWLALRLVYMVVSLALWRLGNRPTGFDGDLLDALAETHAAALVADVANKEWQELGHNERHKEVKKAIVEVLKKYIFNYSKGSL